MTKLRLYSRTQNDSDSYFLLAMGKVMIIILPDPHRFTTLVSRFAWCLHLINWQDACPSQYYTLFSAKWNGTLWNDVWRKNTMRRPIPEPNLQSLLRICCINESMHWFGLVTKSFFVKKRWALATDLIIHNFYHMISDQVAHCRLGRLGFYSIQSTEQIAR